jgi:hypothetical protein
LPAVYGSPNFGQAEEGSISPQLDLPDEEISVENCPGSTASCISSLYSLLRQLSSGWLTLTLTLNLSYGCFKRFKTGLLDLRLAATDKTTSLRILNLSIGFLSVNALISRYRCLCFIA